MATSAYWGKLAKGSIPVLPTLATIVHTLRSNWHTALRKKTEPKQCPLGTVLKNGALFSKKGTKTVP